MRVQAAPSRGFSVACWRANPPPLRPHHLPLYRFAFNSQALSQFEYGVMLPGAVLGNMSVLSDEEVHLRHSSPMSCAFFFSALARRHYFAQHQRRLLMWGAARVFVREYPNVSLPVGVGGTIRHGNICA